MQRKKRAISRVVLYCVLGHSKSVGHSSGSILRGRRRADPSTRCCSAAEQHEADGDKQHQPLHHHATGASLFCCVAQDEKLQILEDHSPERGE